jgi:hypothetical protein
MKLVEAHIAKKQAEFAKHEFFSSSRLGAGGGGVLAFAPDLTFWVMAFQDVLRLNATLTKDPTIRKIVRHHRAEDAGHDRWFLDDLAAMQIPAPDVRWLFGERHTVTRDSTYMLISECYRATDDRMRLVLVQTLESAGHIFFGQVAAAVEKAGWTKLLKYFSFSHLEVEKNHEVFEAQIAKTISAMKFEPKARAEAKALVDRCYLAFTTMFDALCAASDRTMASMSAGFIAPAPSAKAVQAPRPATTETELPFVSPNGTPAVRVPRTRTQA